MELSWNTFVEALLIGLTGTGGVAGLALAFRKVAEWLRLAHHRSVFQKVNAIYTALQTVMNQVGALRVCVVKSENNGGRPQPGTSIFLTMLYEVWDNPTVSIKTYWQRREIDQSYTSALAQLVSSHESSIVTAKLVDGTPLKDTYEVFGVGQSCSFELGSTFLSYYFMSIHFAKEQTLTPTQREAIRLAVAELKALLGFSRLF